MSAMTQTNKLLELAAFKGPRFCQTPSQFSAEKENARLLPLLTLMAQEIERLQEALRRVDAHIDCPGDFVIEALEAHELAMKQMLEGGE